MGFPRILSKNNKIYTKLGDFCLSGDGSNFWIVCHTCQEELQTQDHFWKHIQDEHNFLHAMNKEFKTNAGAYLEAAETSPTMMPLPLYRKLNVEEQQREEQQIEDDDSQDQQEPKDYTEMRAMEQGPVQIDIKVEPHTMSQPLPPPPPQQTQVTVNAGAAVAGVAGGGNGGGGAAASSAAGMAHAATTTLYQIPNAAAYASIVQAPALPTHTITNTNLSQQVAMATLMPQEQPKDSNSTTASASSAVSSEDGERWFVCDHDTCGLKFKYQSRLELHRSVHSKERRFACEMCGASFKQSCNLSTHRKKKHFLKGSKTLVHQAF